MTKFILAHAGGADRTVALDSCSAQIREQTQGAPSPTLGWCYFTDYYAENAASLLEALRERWPGVHWVGAAGVGIGAGSAEYFDEPALALMLTDLPPASFKVFSGLDFGEAESEAFEPFAALVHAAGGGGDLPAKLRTLSEKTLSGYLFGGLSSARNKPICFADGLRPGGLSGVAFGPDVSIVSRVTQGCQPIGPQRVVTRAEGNYLVTLDNAKALECAAEDLGLSLDISD
ncbi:MAG TPA: FIST N-terminal domain-containing protein, partial [Methylocystis sp.]|nr:FIST N-terminal domain-containing protein [Methylocystis sp.]